MLQHIHLENFRCFEHYDIDFKSGVNLLIGDNGSGKTSIIKAVILALNSFFKGFSDENTTCTGIGIDDFNHTVNDGAKSMTLPVSISFDTKTFSGVTINRTTEKAGTTYLGAKEFNKANNLLQSTVANESRGDRKTALPLFAYFATDDIHGNVKTNAKAYKEYFVTFSFGYYQTLRGGYFLKNWIDRLLALKEGAKGEEELEIVRKAVIKCLGQTGCRIIKNMSVRPIQGHVYFDYMDGREARFEDLSDGYRRLVNIVLDLAFRCCALNRTLFHDKCCEETCGVVCIDELDDHLHPALQSTVIRALQQTFPKLQFIISTHAPLIMTSVQDVPANQVIQLGYHHGEYTHEVINTYGLDASTIIKEYLHVPDRDKKVAEELVRLENLIDEEKVDEAKVLLSTLRDKYSDRISELSNAEAMLSFYE